VLNRVLRHNLRNEMNVIQLTAEHIATGADDTEAQAERIMEQADALVELAEQVHRTERVVGGEVDRSESVGVADLLERIAARVREEASGAEIDVSTASGVTVETDRALLDAVLWNVIDNAASHGGDGPHVAVSAEVMAGWLVVRVADDGPGIPDHEVAAIRAGSETELLHGSGMGLWLVDWATTRLGGEVAFGESALGGAEVTVRVPGAEEG
jgi:signal transduction histidine kinase